MEIVARLNDLRIAPRKVRLVADSIRGKQADRALALLKFRPNKASVPLLKLLNSALANAKNSSQLTQSKLYIFKITVDEGRKLKRWRARAMGRAFEIQKKTSRVTLVLREQETKKPKNEKTKKPKNF